MAKLLYRYTCPSSLLWRTQIAHTVRHILFALAIVEKHFLWSAVLHRIRSCEPLPVVTDFFFLFLFKRWITEVKYSDPGLHLASKGGIQPLCTVGAAASKAIVSIHTGKCLQHLVITSRGKAGFSYRFPVGPGTENSSRAGAAAEDSKGHAEWSFVTLPASQFH